MRRRTTMRLRLTLGMGLVTAVFLALATTLFTQRAEDQVINAVAADQVYATGIEAGDLAGLAADVYFQLEALGLLREFWAVLEMEPPGPGTSVVIGVDGALLDPSGSPTASTGGPTAPIVIGDQAGEEVLVEASTVLAVGEPLLNGVSPDDLVVVGATTGAVTAPSPAGADVVPTPVGSVDVVAVPNLRGSVTELGDDLWLASGLFTLLAMGATWLLTGRALRPVEAITRRVDEISAAGGGDRVPVPDTRDEIGHLARTVNTMLERLDRSAATQRRFVADASHELRSPLAVIRTEAEVALSHPDHTDWPTTVRTVLGEAERLEALVGDLLLLARRDDGHPVDRSGTVDVDEVALEEAARQRRVPVDTAGVLAGRVVAHRAEVERVVRHLLDNAARHAASTVQMSVRPDGERVVVMVDDDGDGVPEAERARIFERFARLEESRSRDAGGAGLGLAVVAAVVADLGGTVAVDTAPLGGARFTVSLPAAP